MNHHPELSQSGYVTPTWLKHYLQISNSTMYAWVESGVLPPLYRVGPRAMRFRAEDIRRFEEERTARDVQPR